MSSPDLAVCIVNWNTRDLLTECLEHLDAVDSVRPAVWVLDNDSSDDSVQRVRERFPRITLIQNPSNLGFAGGVNRLLSACPARFLLLLNTDARPGAGAIALLQSYLEANPGVAAVGAMQVDAGGRFVGCHDRFPGVIREMANVLGLRRLRPHQRVEDVDWIGGACMMLSAAAVREIGLFDTSYFMYSEEVDWCFRARRGGWRITCLPAARVVHFVGKSGGERRRAQLCESKVRFQARYSSAARARLLGVLLAAWYRVLWAAVWRGGPSSARRRSYLYASQAAWLAQKALSTP